MGVNHFRGGCGTMEGFGPVVRLYSFSEEDIKLRYITPAILSKDWAFEDISMEMQVKFTDGKINLKGNLVARSKPKYADYVLYYNRAMPIAIVEAKVLKGRPYHTPICNVGFFIIRRMTMKGRSHRSHVSALASARMTWLLRYWIRIF